MARYFCAINPPEAMLQRIDAFRGLWGHPHHRVEPHITITIPFDWEGSPDGFLSPLKETCRSFAPFPVELGAPGRFAQSRVLFLSVKGEGPQRLYEVVAATLAPIVPADSRRRERSGYHPHLTLAAGRFGIDGEKLVEMERDVVDKLGALPPFTVDALRCYEWDVRGRQWQRFEDLALGGP